MSADVGDLIQLEETADHSNQEELIQIKKTEIENLEKAEEKTEIEKTEHETEVVEKSGEVDIHVVPEVTITLTMAESDQTEPQLISTLVSHQVASFTENVVENSVEIETSKVKIEFLFPFLFGINHSCLKANCLFAIDI